MQQAYDVAGERSRMIVISQPCNPTGLLYSKECLMRMLDFAMEKDIHIVSDEVYILSMF